MQALESTDFCQQMVPLYHTTHNNVQHVYWSLETKRSVYVPTRFSYRLYILIPQSVCLFPWFVTINRERFTTQHYQIGLSNGDKNLNLFSVQPVVNPLTL